MRPFTLPFPPYVCLLFSYTEGQPVNLCLEPILSQILLTVQLF